MVLYVGGLLCVVGKIVERNSSMKSSSKRARSYL